MEMSTVSMKMSTVSVVAMEIWVVYVVSENRGKIVTLG